ncbi:hypothetical protein SADUNF_Sadunf06G0106200 [Salix dunnii]|uniref:Uncharacterized protein n=1 Tax=Salix dunnii TaxID=1413687 RepID=A0A835K3N0_9ROSI|nr:hypothetical protein SADUNF_Sadunf06G0106200 [Salix dunnii]
MAADHSYPLCLLGVMDRLWFHKIILFSEPTTAPKTLKHPQLMTTESLSCPQSSSISLATPPNEDFLSFSSVPLHEDLQISPAESPTTTPLDIDSSNEEEEEEEEDKDFNQKERRTRLILTERRTRSHSASPSNQKSPKTFRRSGSLAILPKSMSYKSLGELELEEVKGFMDLGFIFKKEHLSPRMMSVVPGLQRLGQYHNRQNIYLRDSKVAGDHDELIRKQEDDEEKGIVRPYLSESWLIKRPDSPLLNLRVPRASVAADMKKHLKFWARTVASEIQPES